MSYANNYPLVLTNGANLNNNEELQLSEFQTSNVVILGGTTVVSQAVEDALKADGYNVYRIAGATRYETAAKIATWATEGYDINGDKSTDAVESDQGFDSATTNVANGTGFADALSAGPLAGGEGSPILLAAGTDKVGDALVAYLGTKTVGSAGSTTIDTLRALGLTAATSNSLMEDAAEAIGNDADPTSTDEEPSAG